MVKERPTLQGGGVVLKDAYRYAEDIVEVIGLFSPNDFLAARLNPDAPRDYFSAKRVRAKLKKLSPYGHRFATSLVVAGTEPKAAGFSGLMDMDATTVHRLWGKLGGKDRSDTKMINGWISGYVLEPLQRTPEAAATAVVESLVAYASRIGLRAVTAVVSPEAEDKNPRLHVVEHVAPLQDLGFIQTGERTFEDQDQVYRGEEWRRAVTPVKTYH